MRRTTSARTQKLFSLIAAVLLFASAPQAQAQTPLPNPPLTASCGLDIALVIDGSGSIDNTEYAQMQAALVGFVNAFLVDSMTPTQFALVELATGAVLRQGFTDNPTTMINEINEPRAQPGGQFTNWDGGLYNARILFPNRSNPDLLVFTSDGNPNRRGGHTALGHSNAIATVTEAQAMSWAIAEANAAKTAGTRVISIGIGDDLNVTNLQNVASADATITSNFDQLADDLAALAVELCAGTVTAHKVIDIDGNLGTTGDQGDGPAWTFTTNVDAPDSATPAFGNTDPAGLINFAIDLGANSLANLDVTETLKPGFTFLAATCKDQDDVALGTPGSLVVNNIPIDANDIVSCTFYNQPPDCSYLDDQCNEGVWSFDTDQCEAQPIVGPCDDGNYCTTGDACSAGACAGTPRNCSDSIACTADSCDEGTDQCLHVADNAPCDNDAFCDGIEICDLQDGCIDGPDPDCSDGVSCTVDTCNEEIDLCQHGVNNSLCNDSLFCNGAEICTLSGCIDGPNPNCDDGVACTADSCNEGTDQCNFVVNNAACNNGFYCDGVETCNAMTGCVPGVAVACGDGFACTADSCNEATDTCDNVPHNANCSNSQFCDGVEICDPQQGCVDGPNPNCADSVVCTVDACNEGTDSCDHTPSNAVCNDGQYCTGTETCSATLGCQAGTAPDCNDGVECTTDTCNDSTDTCDNVPDNDSCSDGEFCSGVEICNATNGCLPGADPCPGAGTFCSEPLDQCVSCLTNADCNNSVFCDGVETCNVGTGVCQPGTPPNCNDSVSCTADTCNEGTDSCDHTASDALCSDGKFCTGIETCNQGTGCQAGAPPTCVDAVSCTVDACSEITDACTHTASNALCDNSTFCDGAEICDAQNGCTAGAAVNCSDGIACTVDSCNEGSDACDNAPNDAACNDGQFCNGAEVCVAQGSQQGCNSGGPVVCPNADGFACTSEVCDEDQNACVVGSNQCICGNSVLEPGEECDPSTSVEDCNNMVDDDGDAATDCKDTDCGAGGTPVQTCGADCQNDDACEVIKKDPGTIIFGRDGAPDRFVVHGRFPMQSPIEPVSEGFAVRLSNAYGTIYESQLIGGDVSGRIGGRNFRYRDKSARLDGIGQRNGLYGVAIKLRMVGDVPYLSFKLTAYGDFSAATLPMMTTQVVVGSNTGYLAAPWTQTSTGWKLPLSAFE